MKNRKKLMRGEKMPKRFQLKREFLKRGPALSLRKPPRLEGKVAKVGIKKTRKKSKRKS